MHHLKTKYWYFEEEKNDTWAYLYERQWSAEQYVGNLGEFKINYFIYLYTVNKYELNSIAGNFAAPPLNHV